MISLEKNALTKKASSNSLTADFMRLLIATIASFAIVFGGAFVKNNSSAPVEKIENVASVPQVKRAYLQIIETAARTYNLPASLIAAVIKAESGFNPKAISNRGAIGLMQLGFSTAKELKVTNPFDPVQNILAGAKYLRQLLNQFGGNMHLAIAAYNAGPGAVKRFGGIPPYDQTRKYVPKVMKYYNQYESGAEVVID